MRLQVIVFSAALMIASSVAMTEKTRLRLHNEDPAFCDACLGIAKALCVPMLAHHQKNEAEKMKRNIQREGKPPLVPSSVLYAELTDKICQINNLRSNILPPPESKPKCEHLASVFDDEIDDFFSTVHLRDMNCQAAADLFCGDLIGVCRIFDAAHLADAIRATRKGDGHVSGVKVRNGHGPVGYEDLESEM